VNKTSGSVSVYQTDGLGSVRAISESTGAVQQIQQADKFGVPVITQGTSTQPFGFTGEQADPTGLLYLRARMYDPQIGGFLQRDSVFGSVSVAQASIASLTSSTPH
jgi:RHS repeat-associated protein